MTKFQFRPAALLRIRESVRDQRRAELAEAQRNEATLLDRLKQVNAEQRRVETECRRAAAPGLVKVSHLAEAKRYAAVLRERESELLERRQTISREIEERRQALVEADREVRTLEKLRESQLETFQLQENRQAARLLDETALQKIVTGTMKSA